MKNQIKVFLKHPLNISDSQYYKSIIDNPPENTIYKNSIKRTGMLRKERSRILFDKFKRAVKWFLRNSNLPVPVAYYIKKSGEFDLIHCAHCLCLNNIPWIADVEFHSQMWGGVKLTNLRKKIVKRILLNKNCKKILPWTEETKKQIIKEFPEIKNKIEVLHYAMPLPYFKKKRKKSITLIFSARYFFDKGGLHALEAMDKVTKNHDSVEAICISNVPKDIIEKYSKNKKIKFYDLMPYDELSSKIYSIADIMIYPGYSDSYGFSFVEAQAFGIPIVTVDGYARKELVNNGKTGFIIKRPSEFEVKSLGETERELINEIVTKTEELIKKPELKRKMSENGIKEVKTGKFSLKKRNEKLNKIYNEAVK